MDCRTSALSLAVLATASSSVLAQEFVTYTLSWSEVVAGTTTPVAAANGRIDPGEGARIAIRVEITPGVGSTASYSGTARTRDGHDRGLRIDASSISLGSNLNGGTWSNMASTGPPRLAASHPGISPAERKRTERSGRPVRSTGKHRQQRESDRQLLARHMDAIGLHDANCFHCLRARGECRCESHIHSDPVRTRPRRQSPVRRGSSCRRCSSEPGAVPIAPTPASIAVVGLGGPGHRPPSSAFQQVEPDAGNELRLRLVIGPLEVHLLADGRASCSHGLVRGC
jgi:hypothetical protein